MTNLVSVRGDSQTYELTFVDNAGTPIDLTDAAIVFTVDGLFEKSVGSGITVAAPLTGVAEVTVDPADTDNAPDYRKAYLFDCEVTIDDRVKTPIRGRFIVLPDVTT